MSRGNKFTFGTANTDKVFGGLHTSTSTPFEQFAKDPQNAYSWFGSNASQPKTGTLFAGTGTLAPFAITTPTQSQFGINHCQNTSIPRVYQQQATSSTYFGRPQKYVVDKMEGVSTTPSSSSGLSLSSTTTIFTASVNGGTSLFKYQPTIGTDTLMVKGHPISAQTKCHCITAMKKYEDKSLEELRMDDMNNGKVSRATGFQISGKTESDARSLSPNPANTVTFRPKYHPTIDTEPIINRTAKVKIHCITAMHQCKDKSLEELRMEYYLDTRKVKGFHSTTRIVKKPTRRFITSQSSTELFGHNDGGRIEKGLFVSNRIASGQKSSQPLVQKTFGGKTNTVFGSLPDISNPFRASATFGQAAFPWSTSTLWQTSEFRPQEHSFLSCQPATFSNKTVFCFGQPQSKKDFNKHENSCPGTLDTTNSLIFSSGLKQASPFSDTLAKSASPSLFDPASTCNEKNEVTAEYLADKRDIENSTNSSEQFKKFPKSSSTVAQTEPQLTKKSLVDGLNELDSIIESLSLKPKCKCLAIESKHNSISGQQTSDSDYVKQQTLQNELFSDELQSDAFCTQSGISGCEENFSNVPQISSSVLHQVINADDELGRLHNNTITEIVPLKPLNTYRNTSAIDPLLVSTALTKTSKDQNCILSKAETINTSDENKTFPSRSYTETGKLILIFDKQQHKYEKHPAGITLNRVGYYTIPSMEDLKSFLAQDGSCVVPNFTVGREGYGSVYFDKKMDVAGLNLDEIVHFRNKEIVIYPYDDGKPPIGHGLNREAQVTFDQVWPLDKLSREPIKDYGRLLHMGWEKKLRQTCDKNEKIFVEYIPETGSLVFRVKHF